MVAVVTKIIPSLSGNLTADACIYLDIGRNVSCGKGFNLSYNLYQYWAGTHYYPAAPLFPPLFPLLVGMVWKLFHSLQAAILLNVFIAGINSVVLYYILTFIYSNTRRGSEISFWSAVFLGISAPMQQTAMFAWTEQLSLLCLLITLTLFIKDNRLKRRQLIKVGALFGIGFLIRVDMLFSFLAVSLFILLYQGLNRSSLAACVTLCLGFFIIILPYELFCIFRYNLFYPGYPKVNSVGYLKAIILGGYYDILTTPTLRSNPLSWPDKMILLANMPTVLGLFALELVKNINFLICFLIYQIRAIFRREHSKEQLLFMIGITNLLAYTLFLSYQPRFNYIDIIRFSLVPFIFLVPLSIAGFSDFRTFLERHSPRHYQKLYWMGIFIVAFSVGKFAVAVNKDYSYERRQHNNSREEFFRWVQGMAGEDQLVAIAGNLIQEAFGLQRPIVSVPTGAFLNPQNMRQFLSLYRPGLIIMGMDAVARYRPYLANFTYELGREEKWHRLYSVFQIDYSRGDADK